MSCGCNTGTINSWYDLQNTAPKNPFDLIANAFLNGTGGQFLYSTTYIDPPGGTWTASPIFNSGQATCEALGTDNFQMVANAAQWNFQHQTANTAATLAPPMRKLVYLRYGTMWQMKIPLSLGGITVDDVQLSFLDNAGTRGDYAGAIPVISFPGTFSGTVNLIVTLKQPGQVSMGLRVIDAATSDWSMFESDWVVVS